MGDDAPRGAYDRVGYLHVQGRLGSSCIATLIDQDLALTNAHCLAGIDWTRVAFAQGGQAGVSPVADAVLHPDYTPGENHLDASDIALVRLKHEWGASGPAFTPAERSADLGTEATIVSLQHHDGYLRDQRPDSLGSVRVELKSAGDNANLILVSAKAPEQKLCPGDSGAPVLQDGVMIGIVAGGKGPIGVPLESLTCGMYSRPQILSLFPHRRWIGEAVSLLRLRQKAKTLPSAGELSSLLGR